MAKTKASIHNIFNTLGANNHTNTERESNDYYATDPIAAELLLDIEIINNVWEPACGEGHLSKVFEHAGIKVLSTDLIYRGYGEKEPINFLQCTNKWHGDIVTNPPFKHAVEFIEKALELVQNDAKVIMFLKLQFLEGQARKRLFTKYPPKTIYISSSRIECGMNGIFMNGSAICYCWYMWVKGYNGHTELKWFN